MIDRDAVFIEPDLGIADFFNWNGDLVSSYFSRILFLVLLHLTPQLIDVRSGRHPMTGTLPAGRDAATLTITTTCTFLDARSSGQPIFYSGGPNFQIQASSMYVTRRRPNFLSTASPGLTLSPSRKLYMYFG